MDEKQIYQKPICPIHEKEFLLGKVEVHVGFKRFFYVCPEENCPMFPVDDMPISVEETKEWRG